STLALYGAAHQRDLRDGSNTGQRLAAKAQRLKGVQVFHALYLIRRMAREGLRQLLFRYADAVVGHANEPQAATAYLHANIARARVQRVLNQLFDDRDRPLDHLTGGDTLGDILGQWAYWQAWNA